MKGTARPRTRVRWVMVGVVVWLILATSITLEQRMVVRRAARWFR